jgi:hypothetical protein
MTNVDVFSLPGFTPLNAPEQEERVEAHVDGSIDVVFYKNRPLNERTPIFCIFIGKEFGNQVTVYREFGNFFVTADRDERTALKHYRFLVKSKDVQILPGDYVLRFFADDCQVALKYLSLKNSLVQAHKLPPSFLI